MGIASLNPSYLLPRALTLCARQCCGLIWGAGKHKGGPVPIDSAWIISLIEQREPETPTLEYKRQPYASDDRGRRDFASDVAALANSHGGTLLIGVGEDDDGRACALHPLTGNEDAEKQRIDQWLARQIFPRPQGYDVHAIPVDGGFVMAIQIPQQFGGPFQASHGTWSRFPIRTGRITTDMDYWQLASAFGQRSRIASDMRAWRAQRLCKLEESLGSSLSKQSWGLMHIMPLTSFTDSPRIDWNTARWSDLSFRGYRANTRFNADGLIATLSPSLSPQSRSEYLQFFRNGCIEHGWNAGSNNAESPYVRGIRSAAILRDSIPQIAEQLRSIDLQGSLAMGVALLNIQGKRLENYSVTNNYVFDDHTDPFPENSIAFEEDVFSDLPALSDMGSHLPRVFTDLCRAFGLDSCNFFDDKGNIHPGFLRYAN